MSLEERVEELEEEVEELKERVEKLERVLKKGVFHPGPKPPGDDDRPISPDPSDRFR